MITTWIGGRSSKRSPGGVTRLGPAKPTGLARADQCGSVRTLTPSSWTSSVAWPTQVTVSAPAGPRIVARSLAMTARLAVRGENVEAQTRPAKKVGRGHAPAGACAGFRLWQPPSRWGGGAPGPGAPARAP